MRIQSVKNRNLEIGKYEIDSGRNPKLATRGVGPVGAAAA